MRKRRTPIVLEFDGRRLKSAVMQRLGISQRRWFALYATLKRDGSLLRARRVTDVLWERMKGSGQ